MHDAPYHPALGFELAGPLREWADRELIGEAFVRMHTEKFEDGGRCTWWVIVFDSERDLLTFKMFWS